MHSSDSEDCISRIMRPEASRKACDRREERSEEPHALQRSDCAWRREARAAHLRYTSTRYRARRDCGCEQGATDFEARMAHGRRTLLKGHIHLIRCWSNLQQATIGCGRERRRVQCNLGKPLRTARRVFIAGRAGGGWRRPRVSAECQRTRSASPLRTHSACLFLEKKLLRKT